MRDEKLRRNIIRILIVFSIAFLLLVGYLSYFVIKYGENITASPYNRRNRDKENEVLRGDIYDRDKTLIVGSARLEDNTQKRVYKKGYEQPYAPIVGYYSRKYGMSGLEQVYTKEFLDDNMLNPFKLVRDIITSGDRKGNSLVLTVDSSLQKTAYEALGANKGAVAAMDPKTGEILCMVSKPVFNPATIDKDWESLSKQYDKGPFLNRAIQPGLYPPGSTFKIIVAGEAIENIKDAEKKSYDCTGDLEIGKYKLSDFGNERHGRINLHEALVHSCNITFGKVGMELGIDRLKSGAEDFYFNKRIDFELPVAVSQFPNLDKSRKDSLAQSSIGQHQVTVTPLQMLLAASAMANKGTIMKPYLVASIIDSYGGIVYKRNPEVLSQPVKEDTADKVTNMMIDVVKRGTGKNARISGVEVAGKTGTAEVGENIPPHSWFVAFAPADDPKIAISVIVENGETGGGKAAAVAREIIKEYLKK